MNKTLPILAALTALGLGLTLPAAAAPPDGPGCFGPRQERMARVLDLSAEQQAKIEAIRQEEREKTAPLRRAQREFREKLRAAAAADPFDEAAVRALAAGQAATRTELIVARARTQNRILALLTPEQRTLAEKLRPRPGERKGHRSHRSPPPVPDEES
jgi:protein CpxP